MRRLELVDGSYVKHPTPESVADLVGLLGPRMEFAVLRETQGGFVQAAWGPSVGLPAGSFAVETDGEHAGGHQVTEVRDIRVVSDVFIRYLDGDTAWISEHEWRPFEA